ncbi:helix-turn-helix transcriptional regulator [Streptomyces sp. ICN441]|uniref:Helix-turn-helix transcriptional regulator n=1 Tax=Streptomyces tirandamycinicus TaxID=2174846 RepID=A0A2S1SLY0_9ACTN|nr:MULTISPECIES: LuxR C-terminal-related transcriptional regulator [Streptomyces]AWI27400.1 helix-turn-helix transcriptional regulator [Streptomyces tirandamycinicus]TFE52969.1 helix-turn-helix transcriptional regulator [Streptomyces sp. ICN441]
MREGAPLRRWPLVGRAAQLAVCEEVLSDPRRSALLIFGAAGVGKSRLAEEVLSRPVAGRSVSRAVATTAAAQVPLGAVAHLLPDGVDMSDPVSGFSAVFTKMAGSRDRHQRSVVLVDDLHLLDSTSVMLLRQLMDARAVFLVGTVRTGEPASEAVASLGQGDGVHQLDLAEFTLQEVETLLQQVLGGPVNRRTTHELYTASSGNPLYLRELVQGALATGALAGDQELWELVAEDRLPVTRRLTDVIRHRLSAADASSRLVLETLALCEPMALAHLEAGDGPGVLNALERAELITIVRDRRRTTVRLAHPLYGEVLRADLPVLRRRGILLAQAAVLEQSGARRREDALHLASYQLAATGTADPALLTEAAALASYARDHPRALEFLHAVPEAKQTVPVLLLLGKSLYEMGETEPAESTLARADALAVDEAEALAVALVRTQNQIWGKGVTAEEAIALADRARDRVTSPLGLRVLRINEAAIRFSVGDLAESLRLLADLEQDAQQAPDVQMWLMGATTKSVSLAFLGRGAEATAWAERAVAACSGADLDMYTTITFQGAANSVLVWALTWSGRLDEARAVGEAAYAELAGTYANPERMLLAYQLGCTAWTAGHPASARRWFAEVTRAARTPSRSGRAMSLAGLAASAALLGDVPAAEAALEEFDRTPTPVRLPHERFGEAWLLVARGELSQARDALRSAAAEARERGHTGSEAVLLTDLARLGRAREAAPRLAELASRCGDGSLVSAQSRFTAALASRDADELLAVCDLLEGMGAHLLAAEAANTAAAVWSKAGDPRRAAAAAARSSANADRCEGASTPALLVPTPTSAPLTPREREIAFLASRGMTSRDVAARLTISVRTVDNHLQRVYAKLGITDRRQLPRPGNEPTGTHGG